MLVATEREKYLVVIRVVIVVVVAICLVTSHNQFRYFQASASATSFASVAKTSSSLDEATIVKPVKHLKIALVTNAFFSDAGWGALAYNAAQTLKSKYGHEVEFAEGVAIPDFESSLRNYANAGYDLIIAYGFLFGNPAIKVAKDYSNTKFVVFTGLNSSSNVASIYPMQQQGSFLLGALAAMMSKTGVIGYVGGDKKYVNIINIYEGFKQGAKMINPNIRVLVTYLGDWNNPGKGKQAALSQINSGADILLHVADTSGLGVIEAAKEKGIYAFGAVADQNKLAPDTVLTSFLLDVEKAFDQAAKMVQEGNFSGKIFKPGLEIGKGAPGDGIVYLAPFYSLDSKVPMDVKVHLNKLKEDVISGKIKVPERYT